MTYKYTLKTISHPISFLDWIKVIITKFFRHFGRDNVTMTKNPIPDNF